MQKYVMHRWVYRPRRLSRRRPHEPMPLHPTRAPPLPRPRAAPHPGPTWDPARLRGGLARVLNHSLRVLHLVNFLLQLLALHLLLRRARWGGGDGWAGDGRWAGDGAAPRAQAAGEGRGTRAREGGLYRDTRHIFAQCWPLWCGVSGVEGRAGSWGERQDWGRRGYAERCGAQPSFPRPFGRILAKSVCNRTCLRSSSSAESFVLRYEVLLVYPVTLVLTVLPERWLAMSSSF